MDELNNIPIKNSYLYTDLSWKYCICEYIYISKHTIYNYIYVLEVTRTTRMTRGATSRPGHHPNRD
jgi:hypothetical protein